jgi:hypothetical protein
MLFYQDSWELSGSVDPASMHEVVLNFTRAIDTGRKELWKCERKRISNRMSVSSYSLLIITDSLFKTDLDDAAQAFIDVARNMSMTGQRIQVGGFSQSTINDSSADFIFRFGPWPK